MPYSTFAEAVTMITTVASGLILIPSISAGRFVSPWVSLVREPAIASFNEGEIGHLIYRHAPRVVQRVVSFRDEMFQPVDHLFQDEPVVIEPYYFAALDGFDEDPD